MQIKTLISSISNTRGSMRCPRWTHVSCTARPRAAIISPAPSLRVHFIALICGCKDAAHEGASKSEGHRRVTETLRGRAPIVLSSAVGRVTWPVP